MLISMICRKQLIAIKKINAVKNFDVATKIIPYMNDIAFTNASPKIANAFQDDVFSTHSVHVIIIIII